MVMTVYKCGSSFPCKSYFLTLQCIFPFKMEARVVQKAFMPSVHKQRRFGRFTNSNLIMYDELNT